MSKYSLLLILLLIAAVAQELTVTAAQELPEGFPKCKRDANFDKCLVDAVNVAIQQLKAGNKEFGIPAPRAADREETRYRRRQCANKSAPGLEECEGARHDLHQQDPAVQVGCQDENVPKYSLSTISTKEVMNI
ncbi:GM26606 [Drosophila sechellia]|uniref:GM26606 n=1 Tax=Drosophila sechellia TaxID=7238 RepID=B4HH32_DROSE|nr:GM26606 [Drosophila sechellia]